ncbi:cytochrome c-type protein NapC [Enterovibrio nigricans]|uniref:Cytochrome c-type protein n=1 Tax=Enterovibrio nigricans DSM 22720 TaxID=1121868 RepID=A0A1T4UQQ8_9GAMM|nr:cytochrome c-type protein NapC [Enterovibrio nigricans]PKF50662.1 cytochrome c-type protein NapC [Enterovibrio nigricans]SKA55037.1 cytochrome c-type protein NapC [Enterovibrio nigricans DSM 22720]
MRIPNFIKRSWKWFRTPSHFAIGTVLIVGFTGGIIFWGGFHTGMEMTNQEGFCIGCHEMRDNVYEEYVGTIHYTNSSGVRATCPDCHVPKEWGPKMVRKIQASKELYAKAFGVVDTPQKFEDHRLEMATREWNRMKANDSQECRNCHNFEYMDFSTQKTVAASVHSKAEAAGQTCIDCHKGIAHKLPKNFDAGKEFGF